jgi:hypothetical protein
MAEAVSDNAPLAATAGLWVELAGVEGAAALWTAVVAIGVAEAS